MGQVRWAGWTMAVAAAFVISGVQVVRADIRSDKPAAILVYPEISVDSANYIDTVVRLTNTNRTAPINVHCFYIDANSHCSGGSNAGAICTDNPTICTGGGTCKAGWNETDFHATLTPSQPISWNASQGLADSDLPLPIGVCTGNQFYACGSDADCNPFPGGTCTLSNAGTRIPPTPEDPFVGELKCIAVDDAGVPTGRNDLKGEGLIETATAANDPVDGDFDVASYNALGIEATGAPVTDNTLTLGGDTPQYNGCPNFLLLNHFFDDATDPVPGSDNTITTNLVLVPCSEDLLRQQPASAVVQYLVFNEFEQRFSTSRTVKCFQDIQLCNIDTSQCERSIFNVGVAGTLTGQTRMQPLNANDPTTGLGGGLLGIAVETHDSGVYSRTAAFDLDMSGTRTEPDTITLP